MASGNRVEEQREERWPNSTEPSSTVTGAKVNHPESMVDCDYSDTELEMAGLMKNGREVDIRD